MSDPGSLPPQSEPVQPPGLAAAMLNLSWCQKKIDEAEAMLNKKGDMLKEYKEALKKLNAGEVHKLLEDDYKGWLRREELPLNTRVESLGDALDNWISYATSDSDLKNEIAELKEEIAELKEEKKSINRQLEAAQEAALRQTKQNMPGPSYEPTTPPRPANDDPDTLTQDDLEAQIKALREFVSWAKGQEPRPWLQAKRVGREGFDEAIANQVKSMMGNNKFSMQDSCALVLIGGSGIGKTFATLTAGKGQEKLRSDFTLITLYIGFNCDFGLTQHEFTVLNKGNLYSFNALLFLRLLATAASVLSHRNSLFEDDSDVQKMFLPKPSLWEDQVRKFEKPQTLRWELIRSLLGELLEEVAIEGKRLVLLVAVDEAQELDRFTPEVRQATGRSPAAPVHFQGEPGSITGARAALHLFRTLQFQLKNDCNEVLLLPIATGINPKLSLAHDTKGRNVTIPPGGILTSKSSFLVMVKRRVRDKTLQKWLPFLSELRWPRVRPLVRDAYTVSSQDSVLRFEGEKAAETLLKAALEGTSLDLQHIPGNCAVLLDEGLVTARPIVDFGVIGHLIHALKRKYKVLPWERFNLQALHLTGAHSFEANAFRVLALYLSVFRNEDFIHRVGRARENAAVKSIGCGGVMNLIAAESLPNPCKVMHPFDTSAAHGRTAESICKDKALSKDVETLMQDIKAPGDAVMMLCGGQAPIDFIVLTCTGEKKGKLVLHADYIEAKARTKFNRTEEEEVIKKAEMVDRGMRRCLETLKLTRYALDDTEPINHTLVMSRFPLQSKREFTHLRVLDPKTFIWDPFTAALYAMPQEEKLEGVPEEEEEEEEEGKGQKRERPEEEKEGEVPEEEEEVPEEEEEVPKKKKRRCKKSSKKSRKGPA